MRSYVKVKIDNIKHGISERVWAIRLGEEDEDGSFYVKLDTTPSPRTTRAASKSR